MEEIRNTAASGARLVGDLFGLPSERLGGAVSGGFDGFQDRGTMGGVAGAISGYTHPGRRGRGGAAAARARQEMYEGMF